MVTVAEMAAAPARRLLVIIGSGETSPTMVTVHKDLLARLGVRTPRALLLATPYAFQENADSVCARARRYFAGSVGLDVRVTPGTSARVGPQVAPPMLGEQVAGREAGDREAGDREAGDREAGDREAEDLAAGREAADLAAADWVFAGPGSPSYALAHWQAGPVAGALRERVLAGHGLTVLASAAAATAGRFTLPVYEIYKSGAAPRWQAGLDLLGTLGLPVAVIPHYDNAEGGHYDTRYCYLGERRLARLERELPGGTAVLGVDEHTAVVIDVRAGDIEVRGRGGVTVRRAADSVTLPAGTRLTVAELRDLVRGVGGAGGAGGVGGVRPASGTGTDREAAGWPRRAEAPGSRPGPGPGPGLTLVEVMANAEREFAAAAAGRDAAAMTAAILDLETAIGQWAGDTDEDQGTEQARALLRSLIGRLGQAAQAGLADPADRLRPAVEPLVALRNTLRAAGDFAAADGIRQALSAAALDLADTPDGTVVAYGNRLIRP